MIIILAILGLGFWAIPSTQIFITIGFAGLSMGFILFMLAVGLSIIFGLMDIMTFGHGLFIAFGAFFAVFLGKYAPFLFTSDSPLDSLVTMLAILAGAGLVGLSMGYIFEKIFIKPVYGQHLPQILITTGAVIMGEELLKIAFGPEPVSTPLPPILQGSWLYGDIAIDKFKFMVLIIGIIIYILCHYGLNRTKTGLIIRAGVENREMVQALGYNITHIGVLVFAMACGLAAVGGALYGMVVGVFTAKIGASTNILLFIIVIIGGLGSLHGAMLGAIMVGLTTAFVGYLAPPFTSFAHIILLILVLLWLPNGLFGGKK